MDERFSRTAAMLGESAIIKLNNSKVLVFGLGGVGSFTAEALARSGVGTIGLVDSDCVSVSNLNRQLCALTSTVGKKKTEIIKERILDINPGCTVLTYDMFYLPENADEISLDEFDYIADAIDTVSAKKELIRRAGEMNIPIISCMGTGNKLQPERLTVSDIFKTSGCPLCRVMRRELKAMGIRKLKCVWSDEQPAEMKTAIDSGSAGRHAPASMIFVPSTAGILMAKEIITDIIGDCND